MTAIGDRGSGRQPLPPTGVPRRRRFGRYLRRSSPALVLVAGGIAIVFVFALQVDPDAQTTLLLGDRRSGGDAFLVPLPTQAALLVLGGGCVVIGVVALAFRWVIGRATGLVSAITAFLLALTLWAGAGQTINVVVLLSLMISAAIPLMLGASAGILSERAGTINIGIEGMMLMGAFVGAIVGSVVGQFAGVFAGVVAGTCGGLLLAVFCIRYRVDQIVGGIVLNILVLALTSYLFDSVLAKNSNLNLAPTFGPTPIPVLESIPIIGPVLFRLSVFGYAAFVIIFVLAFALDRTRWGLRVKAVGEHPHAADAAGLDVIRVRYVNVALSGAVAGLAGTYLALGYLGGFQRNITNGIGFIAIAVMIVSGWQPKNVIPVALMFGLAQSLQGELSLLGAPIPSEFLLMAPYALTIVVVAGIVGQTRAPAADGVLFLKE